MEEHAQRLAAWHSAHPAEPMAGESLLDYAERPRSDDWSLRSALVRLAQPEPVRAAAVLEQVRRCDSALHPLRRVLEARGAVCDRRLEPSTAGREPQAPYADARATDLARLVRRQPDALDAAVAGYEAVAVLAEDERAALPLLLVALDLDELAEALGAWAARGPADPPLAEVDDATRRAFHGLEEIGVPRESGPRGRRR